MGLVPNNSAEYEGHNNCICGGHYMDAGDTKTVLKRLGFVPQYIQRWMPEVSVITP